MGVGGQSLNRVVFLDRDGVINAAVVRNGKPHPPDSVAETRILNDVPQALALLKAAGFRLAVITNQPDVARGTQTQAAVEAINAFLASQLPLDHFEVCYHDEGDGCDCRKPKTGMLERAARELELDLKNSFVVGDRHGDVELSRNAGARSVLVRTGYGEGELAWHAKNWPRKPEFIAADLTEAVQWILQEVRR